MLEVARTRHFDEEAQKLIPPEKLGEYLDLVAVALQRKAEFGQLVKGTANTRVWPLFPGDGFAYVFFYRLMEGVVVLTDLTKRPTPVSPQLLNLED